MTVKGKVGRPMEYGSEVIDKTKRYIQDCIDEPYQQIKTEGKDSTTWENKLKVKVPTKEGLALFLCVSRQTIYDWGKKYPEFAELLEQMMAIQADRLVQGGLSGEYNSTISKVMLSNHGYVEKVQSDNQHRLDTLTESEKKKLLKLLK